MREDKAGSYYYCREVPMDSDELRKLRQFYHSLLGQQRVLADLSGNVVRGQSILPLEHDLKQLNEEFPSLMPPFIKDNYFSHLMPDGQSIYNLTAIQSHIAMALGRLQIAVEQPASIPVTEKRQFAFVSDLNLRTIIERDYNEIQRAYVSECWKSVIILCGGGIEAILTDLLISNKTAAKATKSAPRTPDITRWDLSNLIDVAVELTLVSTSVEKLSHPIREYRNLVHPGNELRNKLRFDAEEAT